VTDDLVLVECLLAAPASGVRLAAPYRVVAGEAELADRFTARSPIQRTEMGLELHPVERAFDELKEVIRTHRQRLLRPPTNDQHQEGVAPSSEEKSICCANSGEGPHGSE
jgi:hypothetical protein